MKKLYLDTNVFSCLRPGSNSRIPALEAETIIELFENRYIIAFSPAHLEDIAASAIRDGTRCEIIRDEIRFLTKIAKNHSLRPTCPEKLEVFYDEEPIECYRRVISEYYKNDIAEENEEKMLKDANLNPLSSPKQMNNIDAEEILQNRKYRRHISAEMLRRKLLKDEYEMIRSLSWCFNDIKDRFYILESYVELASNLLEKIGFHREKCEKYRSRFYDVSHIIYASYCDAFMSADKKLVKKARAIYSMLCVPANVILFSDFRKNLDV